MKNIKWENNLTIDDLNEILDKLNKIFEEKEKFRTYPVVIFGLDDDVVSEVLKRCDEAYEKYGLTLNKVETIEQFDYHLKCSTYHRTPILFAPNTEQFRAMAFNDNDLLKNGKIFCIIIVNNHILSLVLFYYLLYC